MKNQGHIFRLIMVIDIFQAFRGNEHDVIYGDGIVQVGKILIHVCNIGILKFTDHFVDTSIMQIEGAPVHISPFCNIGNCDLIQGLFIQQFQ